MIFESDVILYGRTIQQAIDREERASFVKELIVTGGKAPLAMVRKRLDSAGGGTRAPVLLVHGFGQNRYAWHLPARSMANYLAREGYDVYNLDLRGHGRSRHFGAPRPRTIHDYVREDLPAAVEEVMRHGAKQAPFLIGHSLGGLVNYAAAPRLQGAVRGIASIGSPYHFTRGSASLRAIGLVFEGMRRAGVPHVGVPVPIELAGSLMRRIRRVAESPLYPLPLRGWLAGSLEPDVLDQHLRLAFDHAGLTELRTLFEWGTDRRFGGQASDYVETFESLDIPLLVIAGTNDDLAPSVSVRPAFERSRSRDKTYRTAPLGHIDLLVGRYAPKTTWRHVSVWLNARAA